jgi:hypothetical protein
VESLDRQRIPSPKVEVLDIVVSAKIGRRLNPEGSIGELLRAVEKVNPKGSGIEDLVVLYVSADCGLLHEDGDHHSGHGCC